MAKAQEKLTFQKIKALEWKGKDKKIYDGGGLYIHLTKSGKYWRMKYHYNNKEKLLSFGSFSEVTIIDAREKRRCARILIKEGIDPAVHMKIAKESNITAFSNTFELVSREWLKTVHYKEVSQDHGEKNGRRLEMYIFPFIGHLPISKVSSLNILKCLKSIEDKGFYETAHRVKYLCEQILNYAIVAGHTQYNVVTSLTKMLTSVKAKNYAAITDPKEFGILLNSMDNYFGSFTVAAALRLLPLVFVRPGELREAKWEQINFHSRTWEYLCYKRKVPHIVPLSLQAMDIIVQLYKVNSGSPYLFPSDRCKLRPISNNTVNAALRSIGYSKGQITAHGFRASARTILAEVLNEDERHIEHQLAHIVKDSNGTAYNRTSFLMQRKIMMQKWADYIDQLKKGVDIS